MKARVQTAGSELLEGDTAADKLQGFMRGIATAPKEVTASLHARVILRLCV